MEKNLDVLLSHTSYQRTDIEKKYIETVRSGYFTGNVYPKIIGHCPIATPTVMVRRRVFSEEIKFKETLSVGEDAILWIQIARKSPILGIEEPLSTVRIDKRSASMNPRVQIKGIINIINNTLDLIPSSWPEYSRCFQQELFCFVGVKLDARSEVINLLHELTGRIRD